MYYIACLLEDGSLSIPAFSFKSIFFGHESQEIVGRPFLLCFQNVFLLMMKWKVEMAPTGKNEWMMGSCKWRRECWKMSPVHKSADVPWLLMTDTHPLTPQPNCLLWLHWAVVEAKLSTIESVIQQEGLKLWNQAKQKSTPMLLRKMKRYHVLVSEYFRDYGNGIPMTRKAEGWLP